jgi:hypothetical protein
LRLSFRNWAKPISSTTFDVSQNIRAICTTTLWLHRTQWVTRTTTTLTWSRNTIFSQIFWYNQKSIYLHRNFC